MTDSVNDRPDDIERLKALLAAARADNARIAAERDAAVADRDRLAQRNERLVHTSMRSIASR